MRKHLEEANELKLQNFSAYILYLVLHDLEIGNTKECVVYIVKYFQNDQLKGYYVYDTW